MKVLHLDFTGTFNEEMSYQENLMIKYNVKDGHEVIMLTTCFRLDNRGAAVYTPPIDKTMNNGARLVRMKYHRIINNRITNTIRKIDGIHKFLDQSSPDIIFIHGTQTIEILTIVKYLRKNPRVHVFVDSHTDYVNSVHNWLSKYILHPIIWRYCTKKIEPYVIRFYGVTPGRCSFLNEMYKISNDKIELLVLGADDENIRINDKSQIKRKIRESLQISDNDFVVITGGKIDQRKNIHLLMKAVNEIANKNLKLIVFGSSDMQMKLVIDALSNSEAIRNIGWIDSSDVYDYFLASDLAVFPGTHSVLWEQSVGTGIPGVFKYWEGMDHIDIGGNCRFLYADKITEIKSVLEEIINDQDAYKKMKKVAEEEGISKFSYREISRRAIQINE